MNEWMDDGRKEVVKYVFESRHSASKAFAGVLDGWGMEVELLGGGKLVVGMRSISDEVLEVSSSCYR